MAINIKKVLLYSQKYRKFKKKTVYLVYLLCFDKNKDLGQSLRYGQHSPGLPGFPFPAFSASTYSFSKCA